MNRNKILITNKNSIKKKLSSFYYILIIILYCYYSPTPPCFASNTFYRNNLETSKITVKSSILVDKPEIDASILFPDLNNSNIKNELKNIVLGKINEPLGQIILERNYLLKILGSYAEYFELPQRILVRRKGKLLPKETIDSKIKDICLREFEKYKDYNNNIEIIVNTSQIPSNIAVPDDFEYFNIIPISNNKLGMRVFALEISSKSSKDRKIIQAHVSCKVKAAKLNKFKKKGEVITENDIQITEVIIKIDGQQIPPTYDTILGKTLKSYKSPSTIIQNSDIELLSSQNSNLYEKIQKTNENVNKIYNLQANKDLKNNNYIAVKAGDIVDFIVTSGNLTLKVPAKALQSGSIGSKIKLINLKNNREISGVVSDAGRVECEIN